PLKEFNSHTPGPMAPGANNQKLCLTTKHFSKPTSLLSGGVGFYICVLLTTNGNFPVLASETDFPIWLLKN
ncbi:MAG: hypothetical protein AB8B43_08335, partial [Prochlorococcus sp.]